MNEPSLESDRLESNRVIVIRFSWVVRRSYLVHRVETVRLSYDATSHTPFHLIKNLGNDDVQAEHLAVVDVQQDATVYCLGSPDGIGDSEHCWSAAAIGKSAAGNSRTKPEMKSRAAPCCSYRDSCAPQPLVHSCALWR